MLPRLCLIFITTFAHAKPSTHSDGLFVFYHTRFFMSKTLRLSSNSYIAGVCAGLAEYFDVDPTFVRVLWILFCLAGGSGVLLYLILWIVMPR